MHRVAAIILAAGGSTRFGAPKQLLEFRGETLVAHAARCACEGGCDRVLVLAGAAHAELVDALTGTAARVIAHADWSRGIGSTIAYGVRALRSEKPDALVLLACDQPLVTPSIISALIRQHDLGRKPIVASRYAHTLGIPALFDASCFDALENLLPESGAKSLIHARANDAVAFPDGAIDIDTLADFERLRARE
ncbi:MAG: nucleotidyltransferase family protein [Verrucomicrobiota bacterium]|nr:nucleotidyltransferase family protein [Verrucomicrobiota bacterium]